MATLGQIVGPNLPIELPWACSNRQTCCESEVLGPQDRAFAQRRRSAHGSARPSSQLYRSARPSARLSFRDPNEPTRSPGPESRRAFFAQWK